MQGFRWIALQGSSRGFLPPLLLFYFITTSGIPAHAADDPTACRTPVARIVSIQGSIELLRARQNDWSKVARLDTPLCEGDRLRTGTLSRAALFIQPETLVRVDQNTSISVSQTAEETLVEFIQEEVLPAVAGAYSCGAGYFITRFPRKFKVKTPHLNAAVEGTEFLVAMRCERTELSVFEGKVLAAGSGANIFPAQSISSGQVLTIGGSEPPAIKLQLKPTDAVQWTLYYPPISPAGAVPVEDCLAVGQDSRLSCLIARAEHMLRAGRVEEARAQIGDALAIAPDSSDAKALSSIVSLVRNDKAEALRLAREAVEASANSAPAWLALSYAQQAAFKLEGALTSAQRAAELTPSSALALARVAELQLSLGWSREAEKTAKQAVAANPSESRAHMILGFVHLAQIKVKEARENFERAIQLDSTDPLSRLGLGLAIIRKGNLKEGREQIEIAVTLDPTNSLIRSYVGKAYYEENTKERERLASTQFGLAKQLDPKDPTPWFYDAILKQSQNLPASALEYLQKSTEINDNRAVSRSRFLLDDDAATRSASTSTLYETLGFEKLAIQESADGLARDPGNHSAHRLLANAYANLPRHDIARVSEVLQSQLRRPLSFPGIDPRLANDNLLILRDSEVFRVSQMELTPLFNRDGARFLVDAGVGSRSTLQSQAVAEALHDKVAFSLSNLHYETDGFAENGVAKKDISEFFLHEQPSPQAAFQIDVKSTSLEAGNTFFAFDPVLAQPTRIADDGYVSRISGRYAEESRGDWIATAALEKATRLAIDTPSGFVFNETDIETSSFELQNLSRFEHLNVVSGAGYVSKDEGFVLYDSSLYAQGSNAYVYGYWSPARSITLTLGVAGEWYRVTSPTYSSPFERSNVSPKLGLTWMPTPKTTIRAASFSSLRRPLAHSQTIEPTQISGFNQFFTGFEQFYGDIEGTLSKRLGLAIDQVVSKTTFVGLESTSREMQVPLFPFDDYTWRESTGHGYLYHAFGDGKRLTDNIRLGTAVSLEAEFEHIERPPILTGPEGILHLDTVVVPIGVHIFLGQVTFRGVSNYIRQKGDFSIDVGQPIFTKDDSAWIFDSSIEYRFPKRAGTVFFGIRNIFDRSIDLVETDPFNPRIATGRFFYAKVRILF